MLPEGKCRRSQSYLASVVTSTSRVFPFLKARSISLGKRAHSKFPHFSKESLLSHDLCSSVVDLSQLTNAQTYICLFATA